VKSYLIATSQIWTGEQIMAGIRKQRLKSEEEEVLYMFNKGTDKTQTGKPDRGKNSPFKKKTPQSRA